MPFPAMAPILTDLAPLMSLFPTVPIVVLIVPPLSLPGRRVTAFITALPDIVPRLLLALLKLKTPILVLVPELSDRTVFNVTLLPLVQTLMILGPDRTRPAAILSVLV